MKSSPSSLASSFLLLLWLNILDILLTNPACEANPFTLYVWGKVGVLLSAWIKIGLVLLFGVLIVLTKKSATPSEWAFSSMLFQAILILLGAFYSFVVIWNSLLFIT